MQPLASFLFVASLLFFFALFGSSYALSEEEQNEPRKRYDGHQVLRFHVQDEEHAKILHSFVKENSLDAWSHRLMIQHPYDINIPPHLLKVAYSLGIKVEVFIEDLQLAIEKEESDQILAKSLVDPNNVESFFQSYQQFDQIQDFVKSLVSNYSTIAQYIEIGKTHQGLPIFGVLIGGSSSASKPGFVFNGGQHAREWISPMTVTYLLYSLLSEYQSNPSVSAFSWTVIPVVNGDGYVYTQTDRMWRKNRRVNNAFCKGVDINRNWDNHFNQGGSSTNPCDETYCGPNGFSEPEESALAYYIGNSTNVQVYIDFHSYSQLWMTPWGWTNSLPADYKNQLQGANTAVKALSALYGTKYTTGNIYATIYEATGSSVDWTYGNSNVKYSYAVELRDQGQNGFLLPPDQILPSGKETLAAILALAQYVQSQL